MGCLILLFIMDTEINLEPIYDPSLSQQITNTPIEIIQNESDSLKYTPCCEAVCLVVILSLFSGVLIFLGIKSGWNFFYIMSGTIPCVAILFICGNMLFNWCKDKCY